MTIGKFLPGIMLYIFQQLVWLVFFRYIGISSVVIVKLDPVRWAKNVGTLKIPWQPKIPPGIMLYTFHQRVQLVFLRSIKKDILKTRFFPWNIFYSVEIERTATSSITSVMTVCAQQNKLIVCKPSEQMHYATCHQALPLNSPLVNINNIISCYGVRQPWMKY